MLRIIPAAIAALLLTAAPLPAQDDSAAVLDDATAVAQTAEAALEGDDADMALGQELAGAQATGGPIAYGTVWLNGAKQKGTPNWSSSYNSTYKRYEIQISGESYYYLNYATLITPAGDNRFCKSSSVGGKLLVYCYDAAGAVQQARFGFVTFKP